jgi:hypothetical protein
MAKFEIEEIYWVDSASSAETHWETTTDCFEELKENFSQPSEIRSIGYIIYEDQNILVMCQSLGEEAFQDEKEFEFHSIMRIPKICIQERKKPGS